jgi:hypothetical protein
MADIAMWIPSEHVEWFRKNVKEEMEADRDGYSVHSDRDAVVAAQEKEAGYIALLDQLGWEDDDNDSAKQIHLDVKLASYLVNDGLTSLGERMMEACGEYREPLDVGEVEAVATRAVWLVRTQEALEAEAVTV